MKPVLCPLGRCILDDLHRRGALFHLARRICGSEAEDVLAGCIENILYRPVEARDPSRLARCIVKRAALKAVARQRRRPVAISAIGGAGSTDEHFMDASPGPDYWLDVHALSGWVQGLGRRCLPTQEWEAFWLAVVLGKSTATAARLLGANPNTVKSWVQRARSKLMKATRRCGVCWKPLT